MANFNNGASNTLIAGTSDNDSIYNDNGDYVTITAEAGNDTIILGDNAYNNVIEYASGDGNDVITGLKTSDTVKIGDGTAAYSTAKSGSDIVLTVGKGKVTLTGAATLDTLNIAGTLDTTGGSTVDTQPSDIPNAAQFVANTIDDTIVTGSNLDDMINNYASTVKVCGNDGNDLLTSFPKTLNVTLTGGAGNDSLWSWSEKGVLDGGAGDDYIYNTGDNVTFNYSTGDGNDYIEGFNATSSLNISGDNYATEKSGDDLIVTIGEGKVTLAGAGSLSTLNIITGLILDDTAATKVTLAADVKTADASKRTTAIKITANKLDNSIVGGSGKDTISAGSGNDTVYGGAGDDYISGGKGTDLLWGQDGADTFLYASGDGNDVIYGFEDDDLLQITGTFTTAYNYEDETIKFTVGKGSITLKDFTATTFNVNGEAYEINNSNEFAKK